MKTLTKKVFPQVGNVATKTLSTLLETRTRHVDHIVSEPFLNKSKVKSKWLYPVQVNDALTDAVPKCTFKEYDVTDAQIKP